MFSKTVTSHHVMPKGIIFPRSCYGSISSSQLIQLLVVCPLRCLVDLLTPRLSRHWAVVLALLCHHPPGGHHLVPVPLVWHYGRLSLVPALGLTNSARMSHQILLKNFLNVKPFSLNERPSCFFKMRLICACVIVARPISPVEYLSIVRVHTCDCNLVKYLDKTDHQFSLHL